MSVVSPPPTRIPDLADLELRAFLLDLTKTVQLIWEATKGGKQVTISTLALTDVSGTGDDLTINANIVLLETSINGLKTILDTLGASE